VRRGAHPRWRAPARDSVRSGRREMCLVRIISVCDNIESMLKYLVKSSARRRLLRLVWGEGASGNVSELARRARVAFSAAHRELDAMQQAGLACVERLGAELVYRANNEHPNAALLRGLATSAEESGDKAASQHDRRLRAWLAEVGAPLGAGESGAPRPPLEQVVASALSLAHRDSTVARVLPLVLWRQRDELDLEQLRREATRRNEGPALGYFLELAGRLGNEPRLVAASSPLRDKRRRRPREFFAGSHGPRALAAMRRNTPREARRWGFLMNMGVDSFRATFDKFARP
jgi:DNA-binding MarR family transcriptional regulator